MPSAATAPAAAAGPAAAGQGILRALDDARRRMRTGTLPNGLVWIALHEPDDTAAAVHCWLRVGSGHEVGGLTGRAHMLEHLMFRGTRRFPDGAFDEALEGAGVEVNAETWLDHTAYTSCGPAETVPLVLELEADRLQHLAIDRTVFRTERDVVANERRSEVEASPESLVQEHFMFLIHGEGPYAHPTIGSAHDIDRTRRSDIQAFYRDHYHAGNLAVVVSGPLHPDEVERLVHRSLAALPARSAAPAPTPPPLRMGLHHEMDAEVLHDRLMLAWAVPPASAEDHAAWTITATLLGELPSSRLARALEVEGDLTVEFWLDMPAHVHPAAMTFGATPRDDVTFDELAQAVHACVSRLADEGPSPDELQRAQRWILRQAAATLMTPWNRAAEIGEAWCVEGTPDAWFRRVHRAMSVTADDVQRVARQMAAAGAVTRLDVHAVEDPW